MLRHCLLFCASAEPSSLAESPLLLFSIRGLWHTPVLCIHLPQRGDRSDSNVLLAQPGLTRGTESHTGDVWLLSASICQHITKHTAVAAAAQDTKAHCIWLCTFTQTKCWRWAVIQHRYYSLHSPTLFRKNVTQGRLPAEDTRRWRFL